MARPLRKPSTAANSGPRTSAAATTTSSARFGTTPLKERAAKTATWRTTASTMTPARPRARSTGMSAGPFRTVRGGLEGTRADHGAVALGVRVDDDADEVEGAEVHERGDHRARGLLSRGAVDRRDPADRHPGDVRRPVLAAPGDEVVALGGDGGGVDEVQVEPGPVPDRAAPAQEPHLHAGAEPAAHHGLPVDQEQDRGGGVVGAHHPAHESVVVEHGHVRVHAGRGAGVDRDGPGERLGRSHRDDPGGHQGVPGALGAGQQPVQLGGPVPVHRRCREPALELGVLGLEPGHVTAQPAGGAEEGRDGGERAYGGGGAALHRPQDVADRGAQRVHRGGGAGAGVQGDHGERGEQEQHEHRARGSLAGSGGCHGYLRGSETSTCWRASNSSTHFPAPMATECSGSSAMCTGIPVSCRSRSSRPRSSAPPPVSTSPRSMMSPASSGGVWSSVVRTASTIACSGSSSAIRTSAEDTTTVLGSPEIMSRPRTSASGSCVNGNAEPSVILISSAVRSPSIREYSFFIHAMIDWSRSSPAVRIDRLVTMPPSERAATSVVPPPTSTIMFPVASWTGSPAPIAAAIGSSMMKTRRAPAWYPASLTARCSTAVIPLGTQITRRGFAK